MAPAADRVTIIGAMHSGREQSVRITAAGASVGLHVLALAGALALAVQHPVAQPPKPIEVSLVRPPQTLPLAPPQPAPVQPKRTHAPPKAAPAPVLPVPPAAPHAPAMTPQPAPAAITAPAPNTAVASAAASGERPASAPSAGAGKTAPRADASWSGNVPPPYPGLARRLGEEGEVRLDIQVRQDGSVGEVRLKKSSGSPSLDETAIETVKKWRFKPATLDGKPVDEWYYNWKWVFRLES